MKRAFPLLAGLLAASCTATPPRVAAGSAEDAPAVAAPYDLAEATLQFARDLSTCTAARLEHPHPTESGFTVVHRVWGTEDMGCTYTQSLPDGGRVECVLSGEGREALASVFWVQGGGRPSAPVPRSATWATECDVYDKDGKLRLTAG